MYQDMWVWFEQIRLTAAKQPTNCQQILIQMLPNPDWCNMDVKTPFYLLIYKSHICISHLYIQSVPGPVSQ